MNLETGELLNPYKVTRGVLTKSHIKAVEAMGRKGEMSPSETKITIDENAFARHKLRDAVEKRRHISGMGHRDADLADFTLRKDVIAVVAGLRGQIEGDGKTRLAAVVGDVAGHGIESSITAFQAKYLLRVYLESFRDPAQALEELNKQMSGGERIEEFISLVVVVFDTEAGTLRFASAGHPTAFLWHEREVQPLAATGPLLMLDPSATYISREIPLELGDMVLMYTDGLAEVRNGEDLFGEDRIAQFLSRDPGIAPDVLAKSLLEAARDFSSEAIDDDVAIMAVRRE